MIKLCYRNRSIIAWVFSWTALRKESGVLRKTITLEISTWLDDWLNLQLNTNYHKRKAKSSAEAIFTPSEPTSLISSSRTSTVLKVNNTTPSFAKCFRVHPNFGQTFLPAQIPAYTFMKEIHAPCIELPISRTWHQSHDEIICVASLFPPAPHPLRRSFNDYLRAYR